MSLTQPRLAVGYHFQNDFDTAPEVHSRVRKTYDGPLALAEDYMVFNITKANSHRWIGGGLSPGPSKRGPTETGLKPGNGRIV